jgi:predicted GIY-YIG superfamily endonuclease
LQALQTTLEWGTNITLFALGAVGAAGATIEVGGSLARALGIYAAEEAVEEGIQRALLAPLISANVDDPLTREVLLVLGGAALGIAIGRATRRLPGAGDLDEARAAIRRTEDPYSAYVYRLLDAEGNTIYYGISTDPVARYSQHLAHQSWSDEIAGLEVIDEAFPRAQAAALESDLISEARTAGESIWNQVDDTIQQMLGGEAISPGDIDIPRPRSTWRRVR